jgi:hypothetical protein
MEIVAKIVDYLATVAQVINEQGWVSGGDAYRHNTISTAQRAWAIYWDNVEHGFRLDSGPSPEAFDLAENALAWARQLPIGTDDGDYLTKLAILSRCDEVTDKGKGYVASIIGAYERARVKAATERMTSNSDFVGSVGEKLFTDVTVIGVRQMDGYCINTFADANGNVLTWLTQRDFAVGEILSLKGTIKGHRVFNGVNQTTLTRCRVS